MLWGSRAKAGLVIQTKKNGVLVSSAGSYLRNEQVEGCRSWGRLCTTRAAGESYQEFTFLCHACDSVGCYLGHALA